jgi:hypothetical protein
MMICEHCGGPTELNTVWTSDGRFCSPECAEQATE